MRPRGDKDTLGFMFIGCNKISHENISGKRAAICSDRLFLRLLFFGN